MDNPNSFQNFLKNSAIGSTISHHKCHLEKKLQIAKILAKTLKQCQLNITHIRKKLDLTQCYSEKRMLIKELEEQQVVYGKSLEGLRVAKEETRRIEADMKKAELQAMKEFNYSSGCPIDNDSNFNSNVTCKKCLFQKSLSYSPYYLPNYNLLAHKDELCYSESRLGSCSSYQPYKISSNCCCKNIKPPNVFNLGNILSKSVSKRSCSLHRRKKSDIECNMMFTKHPLNYPCCDLEKLDDRNGDCSHCCPPLTRYNHPNIQHFCHDVQETKDGGDFIPSYIAASEIKHNISMRDQQGTQRKDKETNSFVSKSLITVKEPYQPEQDLQDFKSVVGNHSIDTKEMNIAIDEIENNLKSESTVINKCPEANANQVSVVNENKLIKHLLKPDDQENFIQFMEGIQLTGDVEVDQEIVSFYRTKFV